METSTVFTKFLVKLVDTPRVIKKAIFFVFDILTMLFSLVLAFFIRDDVSPWLSNELYISVVVSVFAGVVVWSYLGLYRSVARFTDTKVLSTILLGSVVSAIALMVCSYLIKAPMPRSVPFIFLASLIVVMGGGRLFIRGIINAYAGDPKQVVVIYGAGACGHQLALSLQHGKEYKPIAFIDDNRELSHVRIANLPIYQPEHIAQLLERYNITKFLVAIPSASAEQRKRIFTFLKTFSVDVLTIPGTADLVSGKVQIENLRTIDITDLLGREAVEPINKLFVKCIDSKVVMVTGAGGSIGSEICRQIIRKKPTALLLYELSEFSLYSIEKELSEELIRSNSDITLIPVLGSVLNANLLDEVISSFNVNTIYHAAAYKHVPIVEYNVVSGIENNVIGTFTCAKAAQKGKVEHFVLISTDKAVRPTNVMGASKRLSELALQALASECNTTQFNMVRFGNVLGSSGSVVPLFKKQIADGGPVTVTHPDITRYFMTIPEAAQLVIQAGSMGKGGEVYVLDMGEPVKIKDLAEKVIELSGLTVRDPSTGLGDIDVQFTGLRPGEKLYEELLIGSNVEGTEHPRIMKAKEKSISISEFNEVIKSLRSFIHNGDIEAIVQLLLDTPLDYCPSSNIADVVWLKKHQKI